MAAPFKKDPKEFRRRKLMTDNIFNLLERDDDCFIYKDLFAWIDTKNIEKKYSIADQHVYHPRLIMAILMYAYSRGVFGSKQIEKKYN